MGKVVTLCVISSKRRGGLHAVCLCYNVRWRIMGHKFNAILSFGALAKEEILLKECWQILRKPRGRKKKGREGGGGWSECLFGPLLHVMIFLDGVYLCLTSELWDRMYFPIYSAGHLKEHIRMHPSHQHYYSHKLKRLVSIYFASQCSSHLEKKMLLFHFEYV